ncbi:MAG: J domain-containing protein, partial [Acidobacteriota bacterium]|nr:J domain-containing protein [Acidobacteriota bacterium]
MTDNHYEILGLPQNATSRQIRERFLELARERHPDRFQDADKHQAEIDFQGVTQAFNILSD